MKSSRKGILTSPRIFPLLLVTLLSIVLIILPLDVRTTISRIGTLSLLYPFSDLNAFLSKVDSTFKVNRELNGRLDSLNVVVSRLIENKYENDRLRVMLGFDPYPSLRLIPAEVIAVSSVYPYKSMLINAGNEKNVGPNMSVVSPAGVVGKTIASGWRSSTVQLLFDPACKVAARIQSSRSLGIVTYTGGRYLTLQDVPVEEQVIEGDSVVTSGLGGIFPEGLFIGTVIKSEQKGEGLFHDIQIIPGADFAALDEVFVIPSVGIR
jgi:rod shape-determining protein MreC